jgi:amino acid transporter
VSLIAVAALAALNWFGISESAKALFPFFALFIASTLAIIIVGPFHPHPEAVVGTVDHIKVTDAIGVVLILKAFAAGCSAVTGVEAIANGVPAFKAPKARTAQRTMVCLGLTLAVLLIGLVVLIRFHHVTERGGVTILAQLAAGTFGKGAFYYGYNVVVACVLGLAANTSFGGLPVLLSLLARDHRLPHVFYLHGEKPVYRHGIAALAIGAAVLLAVTHASVNALIPMYAIGVFIGFTLSQVGLVRGWLTGRPAGWRRKLALNGTGAFMTGCAAVIFLLSKFTEGAWVLVIAVPALMLFFHRIERYYAFVGRQLKVGLTPPRPVRHDSIVIVPTTTVNVLTEKALSAALSMGQTVIAVAVAGSEQERDAIVRDWNEWRSDISLEVVIDRQRSLVRGVYRYVRQTEADCDGANITVLVPEVLPRKRYHEFLHNQRGRVLTTVLRARSDVVIATIGLHLKD